MKSRSVQFIQGVEALRLRDFMLVVAIAAMALVASSCAGTSRTRKLEPIVPPVPVLQDWVEPVVASEAVNTLTRRVAVDVLVSLGGDVKSSSIAVSSGISEIDAAALEAAGKCRFSEVALGVRPNPSPARLHFHFPAVPGPWANNSGEVHHPKITFLARAKYPEVAKMAKLEGTVSIRTIVAPSGELLRSYVVQGVHPLLNRAALDAADKCRFSPALLDGKASLGWVTIPYTFRID